MNWDDLRLFLATAEAGSMRAAAKALKVSHTTISRRIDALETDFDTRLFDRRSDGFDLTPAGVALLPVAQAMESNLLRVERRVRGADKELAGPLVVTLPDMFARYLMAPLLFEFMEEHPMIELEVNESWTIFDLSRREADVAIRFTDAPPDHLIGRELGTFSHAVYGTPAYIETNEPFDGSTKARWIGWGDGAHRKRWVAASPFPELATIGRFDDLPLQVEAMRAGLGIGLIPCFVGDTIPEFERLSSPTPRSGVWLLSHADLRSTARVSAFRKFIIERRDYLKARVEGTVFTQPQ
ncbi:MAG: LysR family transcriptional regulator [Rhodobiaceae bacterium]|nr:MAG: LysR family transcriptional regulator [Rhodobiaceae bacterium]